MIVKCLSVRQPWAWAIIHAGKDIENRTWQTPYRGRLYIHASKTYDDAGHRWIENEIGIVVPSAARTHGALIGHAELVDIANEYTCLSEWFMGPFGFVLQDPVPLPEPIPCRGVLNIFNVDLDAKELY